MWEVPTGASRSPPPDTSRGLSALKRQPIGVFIGVNQTDESGVLACPPGARPRFRRPGVVFLLWLLFPRGADGDEPSTLLRPEGFPGIWAYWNVWRRGRGHRRGGAANRRLWRADQTDVIWATGGAHLLQLLNQRRVFTAAFRHECRQSRNGRVTAADSLPSAALMLQFAFTVSAGAAAGGAGVPRICRQLSRPRPHPSHPSCRRLVLERRWWSPAVPAGLPANPALKLVAIRLTWLKSLSNLAAALIKLTFSLFCPDY